MPNDDPEEFIADIYTRVAGLASTAALVETVSRVAAALGIKEIDGQPIARLYDDAYAKHLQELIRDFSDVSPSVATRLKKAADAAQPEPQ